MIEKICLLDILIFLHFFLFFQKKTHFVKKKITLLHNRFHSKILLKDYVFFAIFHRPGLTAVDWTFSKRRRKDTNIRKS